MTDIEDERSIPELEPGESKDELSPLLSFLTSSESPYISHRILEHLAAVEGGAQMILNLRLVCSITADWIDSLSPSQSKRVFFRIPIKFPLDRESVEKFHFCPPCPAATSIIITRGSLELDKIKKDLKANFPSFFTFWNKHMQSLSTFSYSLELLVKSLGTPNSLRNLHCSHISTCDTHPSLLKLEMMSYHPSPDFESLKPKLPFFHQMAANPDLRRLSLTISPCGNRPLSCNPFEGIQQLIHAKRQDAKFQLKLLFNRGPLNWGEDNFKNFVTSIASSSSSIRLSFLAAAAQGASSSSSSEREAIERVLSPQFSEDERAAFFRSIQSIHMDSGIADVVESFFTPVNAFSNLATVHLVPAADDAQEGEEHFLQRVASLPPGLIQNLIISTVQFGLTTFPDSLTSLSLDIRGSSLPATSHELLDTFALISQSCPRLRKLEMKAYIDVFLLCHFNKSAPADDPMYSFNNLRVFNFFGEIPEPKDEYEDCDLSEAIRNLLIGIFQIHLMPLLKCSIKISVFEDWDAYDEITNCILSSPLAKSLVQLDMLRWMKTKKKNSPYEKLLTVIWENKLKRQEIYGRQGRRLSYFI